MGKPNTRSKNKRQKLYENKDCSSDILRKIYSTGEISQDDVHQLYMVTKPCCQGCRVNSKESPNCFCALVPPSNGTRKTGLWQKITDVVQEIGPDPCQDLRSSADFPAGLTNLGATCYANSILQCLYMNSSFRGGIFSVEPELLKQQVVIDKLARLFSQLHSSKMAFIDSAPFISSLELDNGAQQDSHEFFTLFLSLLEQSLSHSKVHKARTIVQDLFCGTVSHVTRCSVCGKESDASSKKEDFYGLELNVSGLNNLHESLNDYFNAEELQGENQYFCESCQNHVDATRFVKLHTLPSVLNFQLKRCVFLSKTTTKKKLTSVFSFPRLLNMTERLCDTAKPESVYELTAILIHKGTDVNSGHYVAHIKHERSGHWWKFDDEHACDLGFNPFGERSSGSAKCKRQPTVQASCSGNERFVGDDNHVSSNEVFSSSDAYMLMYSRLTKEVGIDSVILDKSDSDFLPSYLLEDITKLNAELDAASENYKKKKETEVTVITTRREEVRSLLSEAAVQSLDDPFFWISTEWLRQWADTINPPPIDNTTILCIHNKVPVSKISSIKRLSKKAWDKLLAKYGGGPELNHDDCCIICLKDVAKSTVSADNFRDCRSSMMEIAEAALAGNSFDERLYYVSKTWLLQWVRRRNVDAPCDADAGPTASLCCPHSELLPEQAAGAKRVVIPESLWLFFVESAKAVKPDDLSGCVTFPMGSEPCSICCVDLIETASLEDNLRGAKLKQRQNHEKLFLGKCIALSPGCRYYLLPSSWLTKWRAYIASGKNASSHLEPELFTVMESLICQKHSRFLRRPPQLSGKRGVITQRISSTDGLTLISECDWKAFCEEWNVPEEKGVVAEIDFLSSNTLAEPSEVMMTLEGHTNPSEHEVESDFESKQPFVRTEPETCEDCVGERESCDLMQKLNYCNEEIRVFLVHGKEAPRSILEASGNSFEPDRRGSKRSRRTSGGNSINLQVSGSTTLYQLKMMIWESFGVVKENQKLHKGTREIEGERSTLADMNIFPGDVLWVMDSEIHENRDIADELSEQKVELQQAEGGFRGTLLVSNVTSQEHLF